MKYKIFIILILGAALILAGCAQKEPISPEATETEEPQSVEMSEISKLGFNLGGVTVMTRNIYVGTNLDNVIAAENPGDIPVLVAEAFQMLLSTNFPERAQALAKEIAWSRPHLVGLQEVSLIKYQSPGDAIVGGNIPADSVLFDYLEILLDALDGRGLDYSVAGTVQNFDVEVPMIVGVDPLAFDDVRLTDFNVVLARHDVEISNVEEVNFEVGLYIKNLDYTIPEGYVAVDAKVGWKTYRFVNTHLEPAPIPELLPIQMAQAQELVGVLENETLPVILVGDFNTPAPDGETYQYIVSEGDYVDVWTRNLFTYNETGYTSPHDPDLRNEEIKLNQRIDQIFVRSNVWFHDRQIIGPVFSWVVGDELRDRTPSGLWPSDHAGVVAHLRIPIDHSEVDE